MKFVFRGIERREKRNALNVIPVIMRQKNVRVNGGVVCSFGTFCEHAIAAGNVAGDGMCSGKMIAQHAQTGSAIQNEEAFQR